MNAYFLIIVKSLWPLIIVCILGLLSLFKSKIGVSDFNEPVTVAARFAYSLHDWANFAWTQEPPDIELFSGEIGWSELGYFPFGAICEPIR